MENFIALNKKTDGRFDENIKNYLYWKFSFIFLKSHQSKPYFCCEYFLRTVRFVYYFVCYHCFISLESWIVLMALYYFPIFTPCPLLIKKQQVLYSNVAYGFATIDDRKFSINFIVLLSIFFFRSCIISSDRDCSISVIKYVKFISLFMNCFTVVSNRNILLYNSPYQENNGSPMSQFP